MTELKLLSFWVSPFAMRVQIALKLKGLEFELQEEDLFNGKSQLLLESNQVYKKIPVLIHRGNAVCESMNIVEYVDEVWPGNEARPTFLPADPYARAVARFWADFIDKKLFETVKRAATASGEDKLKANEDLLQHYILLEEVLCKNEGAPFFGGTSMGFVDIALCFLPAWLPAYVEVAGLSFPGSAKCPRLHDWLMAVQDLPAAEGVLPEHNKVKDYLKWVYERHRKNNMEQSK